jgi:hypothetical protein
MKKRFTITLLLWLFSQQLLAAVWVMPTTSAGCVEPNKSQCVAPPTKPMGHIMPMEHNNDSPMTAKQSSVICDLCVIACQPLLVSCDLLSFKKINHSELVVQCASNLVETFLSTAFRPPILA